MIPRRHKPKVPGWLRPNREVRALDELNARLRSQVILRYARLLPNGRPIFCTPKASDYRVPGALRNKGKPCFPTAEAAEAARVELEKLGANRMHVIECQRVGRTGRVHFHLATVLSKEAS